MTRSVNITRQRFTSPTVAVLDFAELAIRLAPPAPLGWSAASSRRSRTKRHPGRSRLGLRSGALESARTAAWAVPPASAVLIRGSEMDSQFRGKSRAVWCLSIVTPRASSAAITITWAWVWVTPSCSSCDSYLRSARVGAVDGAVPRRLLRRSSSHAQRTRGVAAFTNDRPRDGPQCGESLLLLGTGRAQKRQPGVDRGVGVARRGIPAED